ncbi:contact-dependent growth inhibition system immunity protein [Afifella pfennigii]|uniref:contact-dependent growth inhibition system immunity protein n=1 Tax=Afifella pfennigii TaxID=209897 RepID=UPI00146F9B33|nr:contact-dependent growth inhibition system immunity protein [Afifella pfennigii]
MPEGNGLAGSRRGGAGSGTLWRRLRAWLGEQREEDQPASHLSAAEASRERAIEQLRARIRRERRFEPKPPPPRQRKQAQVRGYRFFTRILSQAVYRSAHPDPAGYNNVFRPQMTDVDLGREARAALAASRFIAPDHPEWDSVIRFPTDDEIQAFEAREKALAGVKTQKALYGGAGLVALELQDGALEVDALRYAGRGGWEGIPGIQPTVLPESVSDAELGAAINAALEKSRNA